jgi:hypothetical protein
MNQHATDRLIPEVHELFDGTATREAFTQIGDAFVRHYLVDRCYLKPEPTVLYIGSGNGQKARPLTRYLSPSGSYRGFDIVKEAIDWCKNSYASMAQFRFDFAKVYFTQAQQLRSGRAFDIAHLSVPLLTSHE